MYIRYILFCTHWAEYVYLGTHGKRTYAHNMLNNVLILFLKAAGFVEVRAEILN
jgi:hypothetical protein